MRQHSTARTVWDEGGVHRRVTGAGWTAMHKSAGYPAHAHCSDSLLVVRPHLDSAAVLCDNLPGNVQAETQAAERSGFGICAALSRLKVLCCSAGSIGVPVFLTLNVISVSASVITTCTGLPRAPA